MNPRIQELIEQATIRGKAYLPGDDGHPTPTEYFDKERYARLLILECAKFLDERCGSDNCNNVFYPEPEELLKHFGVKE
jgi:hypothetical protein